MLILVAVTIYTAVQSGLFGHAQKATNEWVKEQEKESNVEVDYMKYMPAGSKIPILEGWNSNSVYGVADGIGNTIPVPKGFYYVGGNFNTGVVISDHPLDEKKYNIDIVPSGIEPKMVNGEVTIHHTLQGNQFVWIPCLETDYKKQNFGIGEYDPTTGDDELAQVKQYGGFYVARFEAGLATTIEEITTEITDNTNIPYNTIEVPQSKAGQVPWTMINWSNSKASAESMYNKDTDAVKSSLITGTQWDVIINKIEDMDSSKSWKNSTTWGNYANSTPKINVGRLATGLNSNLKPFEEIKYSMNEKNEQKPLGTNEKKGYLWTTGTSDEARAYNTYDVAGNVWEWTDEIMISGRYNGHPVMRSGAYYNSSTAAPAASRGRGNPESYRGTGYGFRVVLYIK